MALRGSTAQERAWNFFCDKGLNHYAISGVMASIRAESGFNPRNLQNSCEKKSGYTDDTQISSETLLDMGMLSGLIGAENRIFSILQRKNGNPSETKKCSWNFCGRNYLVHTRVF